MVDPFFSSLFVYLSSAAGSSSFSFWAWLAAGNTATPLDSTQAQKQRNMRRGAWVKSPDSCCCVHYFFPTNQRTDLSAGRWDRLYREMSQRSSYRMREAAGCILRQAWLGWLSVEEDGKDSLLSTPKQD